MSLLYEKRDKIAYLTLNRPEVRNAVDPETAVALVEAWQDYRDDKSLRCAIITGAGNSTFCSGGDLVKTIPLVTGSRAPTCEADRRLLADRRILDQAFLWGIDVFKPIIAAVNGDAIAGGMEMLYGTDIRIASEEARFGLQEVKWGVVPKAGSTIHLPRQIPYARAMEILLTGELFTAKKAYEMGFVNRVVAKQEVMAVAESMAHAIIRNGPLAVSAIKRLVIETSGRSISESYDREQELSAPVFASKDAQEGPRAFKEKRTPEFRGE